MGRFQARLRIRGTAFAIGLIAGLALSLAILVWAVPEFRSPAGAKQYYQQWNAASQSDHDKQQQASPFWLREFYGWVYTEDSVAQWLMAILGFVATIVSVVALIWLRRTWDQTRRSANAAFAAVDNARDISHRELRAYVFPVLARIDDVAKGSPVIGIQFKNSGLTPARGVSLVWRVETKQTTDEYDLGKAIPMIQPNLGPGQPLWVSGQVGTEKWIDALADLQGRFTDFVAHGRISYTDEFDQRRWTDFRLKIDKRPPIEDGELFFCNGGNDSN